MKPKRAPISGNTNVDRALSSIYLDINELSDSVNALAIPEKDSVGGSGDIRLIKRQKNDFTLEGKFDEGWAFIDMALKDKTLPAVINLTELSNTTNITELTDALFTASFTGNTLTGSEDITDAQIETCLGALGGKTNDIITKITTLRQQTIVHRHRF